MKAIIKLTFISSFLLICACFFTSCKKEPTYNGEYNPEVIKGYKNEASTIGNKMDSIEAVNFIVKQKLREFYELSALAAMKKDSTLNHLLLNQLKTYFPLNDTTEVQQLLNELALKKVNFTTISKFEMMTQDSILPDSIKRVNYVVDYFSADRKLLESKNKTGLFVIKKAPVKFKREFKFYFQTLEERSPNDTIPVGITQ